MAVTVLVTGAGLPRCLVLHAQAPGPGKPASRAADVSASKLLADHFDEVRNLIKPHPGESRWMEIPWLISLWDARQKAAAEGKPIFVWNGSGGAPCAPT
jgi:hypothetical protein